MSAPEHEIRAAAESLLGSSSSYQQRPSPSSNLGYSVNSRPDFLLPADLVTGSRQSGRMSVVRRFFCLFVTFDFLFTGLMWLVCIMLVGGNMVDTLSQEIVRYNIHTSLFDVVLAAASRFTVLLLFYGLVYINHWCIIALSTAGTCLFLIAKVYLYNWSEASQPVFHVLLILVSFVIAWGEAWFLDFRVLPQEQQAQRFLQGVLFQPIDERTDIMYMVAAGGAGGLVQSRDFVNLRHWSLRGDCYVAAAVSVTHPDAPSGDKHIRGENGASCWVIRPAAGGGGGQSEVQWLLNTNLHGWIPQSVVDTGLVAAMLDYTAHLCKHVARMAGETS
ncbi:steroidogenic acute regulatory protein-like [Bacillus rossius redtenbacheri]|uniref:steroidogenic acute regulatory protein-like n=1 Tax=Bacillus rossius redtenbacheri TaxID=93214 RepID=UPI002FDEA9EE